MPLGDHALNSKRADVAIIMGSQSDWATMRHAAETLAALGISHDRKIVSAHRTPDRLYEFAKGAKAAGYKIIVAGAGGAAHLPGMTAALTPLPVFGVPVESKALSGQDSLLSIVQMPAGIPGRHARHRPRRRGQRGAAGRRRARAFGPRARQAARFLPRGADRQGRRRTFRRAMTSTAGPLPLGSTIGIIGGGQLGRMLAMAAAEARLPHRHPRTAGRLPRRAGRQPADRRRL